MTLSFSTKWPERMGELAGQPNYFTNKIAKSVWKNFPSIFNDFIKNRTNEENLRFDKINPFDSLSVYEQEKLIPKLHTIRTGNRWKAGMKIHPVINNRTKDRFQFAPVLECKSVQGIIIQPDLKLVYVDKIMLTGEEIEKLAVNDGFPSTNAFFQYFNEPFYGQIIHWTDLKY